MIIFLMAILGALVGRLIAITTRYLPKILIEGDSVTIPQRYFQKIACNHCNAKLSWVENIPIFGFIYNRGRCKNCQQELRTQGFFLELVMAIIFADAAYLFSFSLPLLLVLAATSLFIACFITDFEYGILPDQFTLPLIWLGLVASLFPTIQPPNVAIMGAIVGYTFFWLMNAIYKHYRHRDGMYPGDFKLNAAIGAWVGTKYLIAICIGSAVLLVLFVFFQMLWVEKGIKKKYLYMEAPYGCYASILTIITIFHLFSRISFN